MQKVALVTGSYQGIGKAIADMLKENGYTVLCADMQGESIFEYNITSEKLCLVLGNEANGVDDSVLLQSDTVISLPMQEAESLNVGVCASVMMYQLRYAKR